MTAPERCDHKFVDSPHCLKCGWIPLAVAYGDSVLRDHLFYEDEFVQLYCGDSRLLIPMLPGRFEAVITDPVWPNAPTSIPGHEEADALIARVSELLVDRADRLVIHLGSQCDPRWLSAIDPWWPFLCLQHLEYAMPSFRGRTRTTDVAYTFGTWPDRAKSVAQCVPGRLTCSRPMTVKRHEHPSPRSYEHVRGLVKWWAVEGPVLDPFAGSGTTLVAAKRAGLKVVGIEREQRFCEVAVELLSQSRMSFEEETDGEAHRE
jgi:site-specific DNA-methyltransferase (adenine-specific)